MKKVKIIDLIEALNKQLQNGDTFAVLEGTLSTTDDPQEKAELNILLSTESQW